jgi:23S rRNA (guanosine2251-2'-O)-methyltransferase
MTEVDVVQELTPTPPGRRYVYGINPVLEALRTRSDQIEMLYVSQGNLAARPAAEILSRARKAGIRVQKVVRERLAAFAEGGVHQGVVAEVREFEYASLEELLDRASDSKRPPLFVVLDEIQDPHNFGAIVRSAHALGADAVIVAKDRAAPVTGTVAKASAGAVEHVRIARVTNISRALEELKKAGLWILAADPTSELSLPEQNLQGPLAVVIGSEGGGIREGVLSHCDYRVSIPMAGKVGSLNASVAAAIVLYEVARQRENAPGPAA